ncbi:MAG: sulfatase-like hydrolase/transferase [Caldilineaceae bacterium]|nr:sulfatase-like hydrolase/transferase [Caldilineaceae bacterium]
MGEEACRFLRNYSDEAPFAMMVGFPGPHCPYDPNQEYLDAIDPEKMPPAVPEVPGDAPKVRQNNIDGNRASWNGVDYTEFTDAHKQKIRAHYAASVQQIDYEIGQILDTLEEQGVLENTIIIFASDHGDYLGDHNLIGKGTFFEGSIHVPLMVRLPAGRTIGVSTDMVQLGDVTATILAAAGVDVPGHMDSIPLPLLGLPGSSFREHLVGMVSGGWMLYQGMWKLAKYSTGEALLFNLFDDPDEQHNLIDDPAHRQRFREMDALLTQEIMQAMVLSHHDKRVYSKESLSGDPAFGRRGWLRTYPQPLVD